MIHCEYLNFKSTFPSKDDFPTEEELKRGKEAIKLWKAASGAEKFNLTGEIVRTKVLHGKTKKQIIQILGYPKNVTEDNFEEKSLFKYPCTDEWDVGVLFDKDGKCETIAGARNYSKEELDQMYPDFPKR